jgi:signal peptidase I
MYCGRFNKGILLYFFNFLATGFVPLLVLPVPVPLQIFAWTMVAASIILSVYALVDSWRIARKLDRPIELKEYNCWYVYAVFFLLHIPFGIAGAVYIREHVGEAFRFVGDTSISHTLHHGDRIIVNKLAYRNELPARGDVVAFRSPTVPASTRISRVAGLPGERIAIRDGRVCVNGQPIPWGDPYSSAPSAFATFEEVQVPVGYVFVLCETLSGKGDSRTFGPVPWSTIVGRVELVYWPRIERVK